MMACYQTRMLKHKTSISEQKHIPHDFFMHAHSVIQYSKGRTRYDRPRAIS
uniref:Uncharacterized protein n=1 Tax=Arundo donax TaxID=35708 RepID=A0A0A9EG93_ARUDO